MWYALNLVCIRIVFDKWLIYKGFMIGRITIDHQSLSTFCTVSSHSRTMAPSFVGLLWRVGPRNPGAAISLWLVYLHTHTLQIKSTSRTDRFATCFNCTASPWILNFSFSSSIYKAPISRHQDRQPNCYLNYLIIHERKSDLASFTLQSLHMFVPLSHLPPRRLLYYLLTNFYSIIYLILTASCKPRSRDSWV